MNKAAKIIAGAAMVALLASSPGAFSQKQFQQEKPLSGAPKPAQGKGGTLRLCQFDTLDMRQMVPPGSRPRLKVFSSKNVSEKKLLVTSTQELPGHFSGRLTYRDGRMKRTVPVTVKFGDCLAESAYLRSNPAAEKPRRQPPGALRDFFRWTPLEDTRAYGGAVLSMDGYGVPNAGVALDGRVSRLGPNWAIRSSITITVGAKKFRIKGYCEGLGGDTVFREAAARNMETYAKLGLEFGTGSLSLVAGPILGVAFSSGKFSETVYFPSGAGIGSQTESYSYSGWKSFAGLSCTFSANFGAAKVSLFADMKWAISVNRDGVPDSRSHSIADYGVSITFPLGYANRGYRRLGR